MLVLDKSDAEASAYLCDLIDESEKSLNTKINEFSHLARIR